MGPHGRGTPWPRDPREAPPIPRFRKLETRLLLSFLLLASVPSLLLSLIATDRISGAIDRLQNPGLEATLAHGPRLYSELVERWRRDAEPLLDELPLLPPPEEGEPAIRERLARSGFHFAAWGSDSGRTRILVTGAAEVPGPSADDWRMLRGEGRPEVRVGRTLRFFRAGSATLPGRAVGVVLPEDLAAAMETAGRDLGRYLQLERVEEVQKRKVRLISAAIFLLTAIASYFVARITARRISRPVKELARAADRIALGDLTHRAAIRADGEIGDLVTAFHRMSEQLEQSREELIRMERIAAWRDVARRIAHEIRNPLTPVKVAIHRLKSRVPGDAQAIECLRSIGEEVENLARISAAFSEFAKLPEPVFASTDLAAIARGVVELFREAAPGVTLEYDGPERLPLVADRDQLRRAATNLVKNAAEVLEGGGTIRVRVAREDGRAILEVEDDGPGIPGEIRDSLFRPGVSGRTGGSGLGLAMVHRIATDHRGVLEWSDQDPGTRFRMEIPLDLPEGS